MPSALVYAKRAEALLKIGKPSAAAADCTKALELNPDSAKAYKVLAKALTKVGDFRGAYAKLCIGNKIDEDEDSAALQKTLKAKVDKLKKIGELRAKRARERFDVLGLGEVWTALETDLMGKHGEASFEAMAKWRAENTVSLKARMGELHAVPSPQPLPLCIAQYAHRYAPCSAHCTVLFRPLPRTPNWRALLYHPMPTSR